MSVDSKLCSQKRKLFEQETALIASDGLVFPEADWLIGNHCDELTPWIPVIAARWHASHVINFFLVLLMAILDHVDMVQEIRSVERDICPIAQL